MVSKYDRKQGVDGIATLTNDHVAMDNIRRDKIRKGIRVMCNDNGMCGTVLEVDAPGQGRTGIVR